MNGELRCPLCGAGGTWAVQPPTCRDCHVPLTFFPSAARGGESPGAPGHWRYQALFPQAEPLSLGEGNTPLVPSARVGPELALEVVFKWEGANPTGSFKDRGASVMVSVLRELGAETLADDSSGNAGAALAAYAARAGLPARLFVPEGASPKKLAQIRAYGAHLVPVPGPRAAATEAVLAACAHEPQLVYASHNASPYFLAGLSSLAWETWEDLGHVLPDHVVVPVGGGGLLLGLYYGFIALRTWGVISSMPKLHAVQAAACAPIAEAWSAGVDHPVPVDAEPTVAEGIRVARPPRGHEILRALRASGGSALTLTEGEILEAQRELATKEGLYVEPTSATPVAALRKLRRSGAIPEGARVVIPLTGTGLKSG